MKKSFLNKVKHKIDKAKVISFDIFDTLLLRPYIRPVDLFAHIEKIYMVPYFGANRVAAEQDARCASLGREEITFDEIYDKIDPVFLSMKDKELEFEERVLSVNPEMMAVYEYARAQGKRIIITSDMYLPKEFLEKVLHKNGYTGYEKFYLSCSEFKTKYRGALYEHVKKDLGISGKDILHIGDNKSSDYKYAKKHGLNAVLYTLVLRQYLRANKRASAFRKMLKWDLGGSILLSLMAWRWHAKRFGMVSGDYWDNLGYEYAGPVCYSYTRWVETQAKALDLDALAFVARDGYTLQRVFDTFESGIRADYVYAPRFLNLICRLDYAVRNEIQGRAIIEYYANKNDAISKLCDGICFSPKVAHEFITTHRDKFESLAAVESKNYRDYLTRIIRDSDKIGMVDTVTLGFSSQKIIQETLKDKTNVYGLYWSVLRPIPQEPCRHFSFSPIGDKDQAGPHEITENWDFMEFLMTSPEVMIKSIDADGNPVYDASPSEWECMRSSVYPSVSNGALLFAKDVKKIFGNENIFLSAQTIIKYINCFIKYPTRLDVKELSKIRHAMDSAHTKYIPLFSVKVPFKEFIKQPLRSMQMIKRAKWRTSFQTFLACVSSPIKLKARFPKRIELALFPKLLNRYFTVSLNVSESIFYRFVIGNRKD